MKKLSFLASAVTYVMLSVVTAHAKDVNILKYGAKPDGITMCTKAIQTAIDDVAKSGGGKVIVPQGKFHTTTLTLKSGVNLHLEQGAELLANTDYREYQVVKGHQTSTQIALINAIGQEDIAITGRGTINGRGAELVMKSDSIVYVDKVKMTDTQRLEGEDRLPSEFRPVIFFISQCRNVNVSQITLRDAASHVQLYCACENLTIEGIKVYSNAYLNNDGIDVIDSKNIIIRGCDVNSSDDAIALSGSHNDHVLIEDNRVSSRANGIKFGSDAGASDVMIRNNYVYDTFRSAFALESVDGFTVENVTVDGLYSSNTWNVIYVRLGNRLRNNPGGKSVLRNVTIRNVHGDVPLERPDMDYPVRYPGYGYPLNANSSPAMILGLPDKYIENITLEDISITYPGRSDIGTAYRPILRMKDVPEFETSYPDFNLHGECPSWGFYVRHVKGITFRNVAVCAKKPDYRPAFAFDDVKGLNMEKVFIHENDEGPQIILREVSDENIQEDEKLIRRVK